MRPVIKGVASVDVFDAFREYFGDGDAADAVPEMVPQTVRRAWGLNSLLWHGVVSEKHEV